MKLKVTVDGKVYEVEVEVAPEPPPTLPSFVAQTGLASVPAAKPAMAESGTAGADAPVDEDKVCRSPVAGIAVKSNVRPGQTILAGDLLFVLVNLARFLKVDPEQALRKTNAKFRKRFAHVEKNAKLPGASIAEMEALWQEAKANDD